MLLDTHPDYIAFDRSNGRAGEYPSELYKEFLTYVRSKYSGAYWDALPREVAAYVKQSQSSGRTNTHRVRRVEGKYLD